MGNVNKKILDLFQSQDIITLEELKNHLGFSERKVREFLSELRDAGDKNGFQIITVSKRGYFLQIIDIYTNSIMISNSSLLKKNIAYH
jgi:lichenan operon transcriptional antiterminator